MRSTPADAPPEPLFRRRAYREVWFALLALWMCTPLWAARYLPIQDLPQHLAAIRVLHNYGDPQFDFARYFELTLFRTQYLAYYVAAHLLSFLFDVELANRILITGCVAAIPYALRSLLRSLDRDERMALFALPLTYNAHLILGFANFLLAIALALWGLALAVREREQSHPRRAIGLAAIALVCFYAHVVPFALLALGMGLIALGRDLRVMIRRMLPLAPAGLAGVIWAFASPAGQATVRAASSGENAPSTTFVPLDVAWRDVPNWLTDILHTDTDRTLLRVFGMLFVLALCTAALPSGRGEPHTKSGLVARLAVLPVICSVLYFAAPSGYEWIWPIAQRFPLLAILFAVPILARPRRLAGTALTLALIALSLLHAHDVGKAFHAFAEDEVGDFDGALESIPPAKRVVGLIYARGSRHVKFSPFIQYVAYYQARKGGAVMFTFADFPQSPFRFRETDRPPRVPPRWEWLPAHVRGADLGWYEYLLVRGGVSPCSRERLPGCTLVYRGKAWETWRLR